ncbi:MAG: SIS domain-containing protein [Actinomycetota bacterium]
MSKVAQELATQPSCWARAAEIAAEVTGLLPTSGERVLAAGCGTSLHVAQAYAALREAAGAGDTDARPASEAPAGRSFDRVVAISRSGTTTEVVRLLRGRAEPSTALVGVEGSPVAGLATAVVPLAFADEESVVQTRFATSALALLRAHLGDDLHRAIADGERALAEPLPVDPSSFDHFVFLGRGWTVGLADEAALKMQEASLSVAESYPALEYRHGPISLAGDRSLVWGLGEVEPDLLQDVRRTGATVVAGELDTMAELVRIQRLAVALAEAKGLDPDRPRHLTRSVVLT